MDKIQKIIDELRRLANHSQPPTLKTYESFQIVLNSKIDKLETELSKQSKEIDGYVLMATRWEAICEILEDKEPSDFMLSFSEVREVFDLKQSAKEDL